MAVNLSENLPTRAQVLLALLVGVISLVVGISSNSILQLFSSKSLSLTYDFTAQEAFLGQTENTGIVAVSVTNSGGEIIENCECHLVFANAVVKEARVTKLLPSASSTKHAASEVDVSVPYLNPGETFSIQVLAKLNTDKLTTPTVDIRGKGVVGKLKPQLPSTAKDQGASLTTSIIATSGTIVGGLLALLLSRSVLSKIIPSGEQRDISAYIFGVNGFLQEAADLRNSNRSHTWWAISDGFTETILHRNDNAEIRRGYTALLQLLETNPMADSSSACIHCNLAKLSFTAGNQSEATVHLEKAWKASKLEVRDRLKLDIILAAIPKPESITL